MAAAKILDKSHLEAFCLSVLQQFYARAYIRSHGMRRGRLVVASHNVRILCLPAINGMVQNRSKRCRLAFAWVFGELSRICAVHNT
nr:hypothetical protein [uncultured bacterium]